AVDGQASALRAFFLIRERAFVLVHFQKMFGVVFALLHVGLIERVDSDDGPCDRGRHLPQVKLLAEIEQISEPPADDRMTGRLERAQPGFGIRIGGSNADVNEEPIVSVDRRRPERFAGYWNNAFVLLARTLGDQLL